MKSAPLELRRADSISSAVDQLAMLGSDARVLAGGQSLLPLLRYRVIAPHVLLDINRIEALRGIDFNAEGVRIGALARHAEIERVTASSYAPLAMLLAAHAHEIAFWPVRNRGTAVGSVMQADPKGDWPLLFCALDARIELKSKRADRSAAVREFITGPLATTRAVDELATAIFIPAAQGRMTRWGRSKLSHRAGEYALCSAITLEHAGSWQCWVGATGNRPFPLPGLAAAVAAGQRRPSRLDWTALADAELSALLPDASAVERHRHAANVVCSVLNALENNPHA